LSLNLALKEYNHAKKKKLRTKFNKYKILNNRSAMKYKMVNNTHMHNVLAIFFKF